MSTYHQLYEQQNALQDQAALLLAVIGLGLALGWCLIARFIPARWQGWVRWSYILACAAVQIFVFLKVA